MNYVIKFHLLDSVKFHWLFTVPFDPSDYKPLEIGEVKSHSFGVTISKIKP